MAGLGNALKRPFSGARIKDAGIAGINPFKGVKMIKEDAGDIFKAPMPASIPLQSPAPMVDDEVINAAKRRRAAQLQQRGGRISTVLTEDGDRFGG